MKYFQCVKIQTSGLHVKHESKKQKSEINVIVQKI